MNKLEILFEMVKLLEKIVQWQLSPEETGKLNGLLPIKENKYVIKNWTWKANLQTSWVIQIIKGKLTSILISNRE